MMISLPKTTKNNKMIQEMILTMRQAMTIAGCQRHAIIKMYENKDFPKPVRRGKDGIGFFKSEVDEWLNDRKLERDNKDA